MVERWLVARQTQEDDLKLLAQTVTSMLTHQRARAAAALHPLADGGVQTSACVLLQDWTEEDLLSYLMHASEVDMKAWWSLCSSVTSFSQRSSQWYYCIL